VSSIADWTPTVVTGGSMAPSLRPGAIVQVDHSADLDSLRPGAITTFDNPAAEGMRVTHRITGVERRDGVLSGFRTKGDANTAPDSTIVPVENIEGVTRLVVPFAGLPRVWAEQGEWMLFNGYTVNVNHNGNTINIDRRTSGSATPITTSVAFKPPEDEWYRLQLVRNGPELVLNVYDGAAALLVTTSATDSTTILFDRLTVRGGWDCFLDDVAITQTFPVTVAIDRIGTLDGLYVGAPGLSKPGLVANNSDAAVDFDGVNDAVKIGDSTLINGTARSERTLGLWAEPDDTVGR
jgi:signal peptidase I